MRGTVDRNSLLFDHEIEKTARKNQAQQRKQKQAKTMAETPEQIEARIRAEFEGRYDADYEARRIQRDRELEEQNVRRSIREITTPDISFEFEGSIVPPSANSLHAPSEPTPIWREYIRRSICSYGYIHRAVHPIEETGNHSRHSKVDVVSLFLKGFCCNLVEVSTSTQYCIMG